MKATACVRCFGRSKSTTVDKMDTSWITFCQTTTTHGLLFIFGKKNLKKCSRFFWLVIFLLAVAVSIQSSVSSIYRYYDFKVQTTLQYIYVKELEFPSVTICNVNPLLRTQAGSSFNLLTLIFGWIKIEIDFVKLRPMVEENSKYCPSNITNEFTHMPVDEIFRSLPKIMNTAVPTFDTSVLKFWWNDAEYKAEEYFVNVYADRFGCFTFNPSKTTDDFFLQFAGKNNKVINGLTTNRSGFQSGLQLLLNTDQDSYCGTSSKYVGAGFRIVVHDPVLFLPSFELSPRDLQLLLTPGREISIKLAPMVFQRFTEHLKMCQSGGYVLVGGQFFDNYMCTVVCFTQFIIQRCGCIPNYMAGQEKFLFENIKKPGSKFELCMGATNMFCLEKTLQDLVINIVSKCHQCLINPCYERKYSQHTLSSISLTPTTIRNVKEEFNMSEETARKNLIMLHMYFDDMSYLEVTEKQAFDQVDLCIYLGGIIGLYLGMSFTTIFEFIYQFVIKCHLFINRVLRKYKPVKRANKTDRVRKRRRRKRKRNVMIQTV